MTHVSYTNLWQENFGLKQVENYDRKFYVHWEKHMKHEHQVRLVKKYLRHNMTWCDAP